MTEWTTFQPWKRYLKKHSGLASPFQKVCISPDTLFLYSEMTAPHPSCSTAGMWFAYPGIQELAAHLQFVILPTKFGIWLGREEWSQDDQPIDLGTLFAEARQHGSRYAADLPVMERIAALLSEASSLKKPAAARERVEQAIRVFNRRWKHTPTWDFRLQFFDSVAKVAQDIAKRNCCIDLEPKAFKALAKRVEVDPKAERAFRKILQDAGVA